jgi:predicted nucleic-acid-binding Zn-ribbon protein
LVLQNSDTCASGVKEAEARSNEILDIVYEHDMYVHCKKCGLAGARIHAEKWSDGFCYADYGCPACGYSEVYE